MSNFCRKKAAACALALAAMSASATICAEALVSLPSGPLRVQSYSNGTSIYFTSSPCTYGGMTLDPSDTPDRNKMLYATVLAAKAMKANLFVSYDIGAIGGSPVCYIRSFGIDVQ